MGTSSNVDDGSELKNDIKTLNVKADGMVNGIRIMGAPEVSRWSGLLGLGSGC